jgi:hypothetical protein
VLDGAIRHRGLLTDKSIAEFVNKAERGALAVMVRPGSTSRAHAGVLLPYGP